MRVKIYLALVGVLLAASVFAQEQKPPKLTPEQQAMMDAWMKFATPGESHKALNNMVGTWDAKTTMWEAPGAEPHVSMATSETHWLLGNRYVQETVNGSFMGMPFQGIGITGYDNAKKQYFNTWFDNFGTGVMTSVGTMADAKTLALKTSMTDPMSGKDIPGEMRITIADADHHTMESWAPAPDGKMFKNMQVEYIRHK